MEPQSYFFDEQTVYLDVRERLRVCRAIRQLSDIGRQSLLLNTTSQFSIMFQTWCVCFMVLLVSMESFLIPMAHELV